MTSTQPNSPLLSASDVTIRLGGVAIVEGVDLRLAAGDLVLLAGPNGAGKSTLLRALVGLLPSSGDIEIAGRYPTSIEARGTFVFTPDEPALYEDLTLAEHARFNALVYQRPEAEERALAWLGRFGLEAKLEEFPGTHSRGMRQKLALALALGLELPLTLLDEPFNGLDIEAQELLAAGLAQRASAGGAVLLTGHQRELGELLTARVLELRDGHLSTVAKQGPRAPHAAVPRGSDKAGTRAGGKAAAKAAAEAGAKASGASVAVPVAAPGDEPATEPRT